MSLRPRYADAYNNRGFARKSKGDLAGAIQDFNEAIRLKPDFAIAHGNRARLYLQQGRLLNSAADFWKSISRRK
ncbi:MAG: tetratricopeptide repeat protein [Chloroflexota bacterium]